MIIRIKYAKNEKGRFLSHLDLLRTMERVFRRANLPLAFSEGFNPHPKVSFGSALAVGVTSEGEYLDIELNRLIQLDDIKKRLINAVPSGIDILEIKTIEKKGKSLTAQINLARYRIHIPLENELSSNDLDKIIKNINDSETLIVNRAGKRGLKQVNIKDGIYYLKGWLMEKTLVLEADLRTGSQGNVRPEELIRIIEEFGGIKRYGNCVTHRIGLFILEDGRLNTPLEVI